MEISDLFSANAPEKSPPTTPPMRIGIDARFYGSIGKGLGRYTSELIAQLERLDTENEYVIFLRKSNFGSYAPKNPRFAKVLAEFPWYGWKEQLLLPFWLEKFRLDLMHFLHFNVPFLYRRPYVVTIHDLILLRHPTARATTLGPLRFLLKYAVYRLIIARALRSARAVITVSNCTRDDIRARFPFMRSREIAVTYEACGSAFRAEAPIVAAPRAAAAPQPFLMYVGNAYPHKNLEKLLAAFSEFRKRGFSGHRLVLVGSPDYFYGRLKTEAAAKKLDENVVFFGHATDEELAALYMRAESYVFPSLCEGFGLPPLEAMCKGVPVASSNASCLPEILGDAAKYFDPGDPAKIADALAALAADPALRASLAEKGRSWSARFGWRSCAERTRAVYMNASPTTTHHA